MKLRDLTSDDWCLIGERGVVLVCVIAVALYGFGVFQ